MLIQVVDLFCGVGGLTHGLQLAGLDVVAGFDIEESCKYAYEANNNAKFVLSDITKLQPEEIIRFFDPNAINVLVGCAPCQPFSQYSKRYRKSGYKDDKWKLLYSFANLLVKIKPDIVAMENVPQLINSSVFADFLNMLEKESYYFSYSIVNCPDYGIPQKRRRLVLLASKISNIALIPPTHTMKNYVTVRQAIGDLPKLKDGEVCADDVLHQASKLSEKNLQRIKQSVPGGTWRDWDKQLMLDCHTKNTGKSYPSVYGRMKWDEPSPTITTQYYGLGNGRFGHPEQDRAISLREGAILQSFPPNYKFISSGVKVLKTKLGTQIGNAVPVELGRVIGISIKNSLEAKND